MAIFKIKENDYPTLWDITNVIGYITRTSATVPELIGTHGIYLSSSESMAKQMISTKFICGQMTGRQLYHIILSFNRGEIYDCNHIMEILQVLITLPDLCGNQSIAAVHTDKSTPDAHILLNSVNSYTGRKLDMSSKSFWYRQIALLSEYMIEQYGYSIFYKFYDN